MSMEMMSNLLFSNKNSNAVDTLTEEDLFSGSLGKDHDEMVDAIELFFSGNGENLI